VTFLSRQVLWGVAALIVIWAGILFGFDMPNGAIILRADEPELASGVSRLWHLHGHWPVLARLAVLTLPLGLVTFLGSLNSNLPNYFLAKRDLAIFNAIAYLVIAGNRVVLALAQSAMPRLARSYANRDRRDYARLFVRLMLITVMVGAVTLLVAIIGGKPLLTMLYHPEYAERIDLFVLVMIAAAVGYIALGLETTITATRHFGVQMPLLLASGLTMLLGCSIFIPLYGLIGAGLAMILSAAVEALGALLVNLVIYYQFQAFSEAEDIR
jgi:O-antigen/teichoic acid export membrane protein